jgi:hypothetical protein
MEQSLRTMKSKLDRDWPKYAKALDMRLEGCKLREIASHFGVSRQRAEQMVKVAKAQLAFRVFKGVPRPKFYKPWWEK